MKTLDAKIIANMFLAGAKNLQHKKEIINELNVFPVPDGDTGTNMTMTIMSAVDEVSRLDDINMKTLAKALANGSLKGARGNSGVILSQLLRGFSKEMQEYEEMDIRTMASAMVKASETAYKAVMRPKEGTILTVAKMMANKALESIDNFESIDEYLKAILDEGQKALDNTPELLPVLKEAGVVDSGGEGLMQFLYGAYGYLIGEEVDLTDITTEVNSITKKTTELPLEDIKFGYCTEFIIMLKKELTDSDKDNLREYLLSLGDSLVFVADEEIVKVHVHTNHPGRAFEKGLEYGELTRMKVDNMREEHRELIREEGYTEKEEVVEAKENGFVAVTVGSGMTELFKELGVDIVVEGGQTMNPSTSDLCEAIKKVNAKNVYILPNNKNIILAANQSKDLVNDRNIYIIPTTTMPEGVSAMVNFPNSESGDENVEAMMEAIKEVKSGEITYAVRETHIDGFDIAINDIMGIFDGKIRAVGKEINNTTMGLIETMVDESSTLLSIYYGSEADDDMIDSLRESLEEKYPKLDIEVVDGGQPVYYYILSVE